MYKEVTMTHSRSCMPSPLHRCRNGGICGAESLRKVGRIFAEEMPVGFWRSLPLNNLAPFVLCCAERGRAWDDF